MTPASRGWNVKEESERPRRASTFSFLSLRRAPVVFLVRAGGEERSEEPSTQKETEEIPHPLPLFHHQKEKVKKQKKRKKEEAWGVDTYRAMGFLFIRKYFVVGMNADRRCFGNITFVWRWKEGVGKEWKNGKKIPNVPLFFFFFFLTFSLRSS